MVVKSVAVVVNQERSVHKVDSSTRRLDDFLLSEAKSHFDDFNSKWIVGASFHARPVNRSFPKLLPGNVTLSKLAADRNGIFPDARALPGFGEGFPGIGGFPGAEKIPDISKWPVLKDIRPVLVGHFTAESYHAIAISLALIDLAKLNYLVPAGHHIQTINHPLPRQPETVVMDKAIIIILPYHFRNLLNFF